MTPTCPRCQCPSFEAAMLWESAWCPTEHDADDGLFWLNPLDFNEPAFRDVEIRCTDCGHIQALTEEEWEFL